MKGTREPHLWLRQLRAVGGLTVSVPSAGGVSFDMTDLDTGIDARRTLKRLLLKFAIEFVTTAANALARIFIAVVVRKLGEAVENASFSTTGSRQSDVLWSNVYLASSPNAAVKTSLTQMLGYPIEADIRAMRILEVGEEIRVEAFVDGGSAGAANIGTGVDVQWTSSALIQRTRR